jgi:hypothetical protein
LSAREISPRDTPVSGTDSVTSLLQALERSRFAEEERVAACRRFNSSKTPAAMTFPVTPVASSAAGVSNGSTMTLREVTASWTMMMRATEIAVASSATNN